MIEANDFYFLTTARDIGVSPRHIQRLIKSFEGWRIYFRQRVGEKERIREFYKQLKHLNNSEEKVIKELSEMFDKPIKEIKKVVYG